MPCAPAFTVMSNSEWLQRTSEGALEKILQLCSKQAKPGYGYLGPKPSSCIRRLLETFNRCQEILVSPSVLFSLGRDLYHTEWSRPNLTCLKEQNISENQSESPRDFSVIPRFQVNSITPLVCFRTKSTRILLRSKLSYLRISITHRRTTPALPFHPKEASSLTRSHPI
jgi:hypothetical protein